MLHKKLNKFLLFLYAFLSGLKIDLVGKLAFGDLIAVIYSILTIKNWKRYYKRIPDIKRIHYSLALFLIIQVISDLYNESSFSNMSRGCSNIIMAALVIIYLTQVLFKTFSALPLIFIGFGLSVLIFGVDIVKDHEVSINDMGFFKFRVVPILNNLLFGGVLLMNARKKISPRAVGYVFIFFGLFCISFDARSNGMFFFFSGFIVINKSIFKRFTLKNMVWILPVFIIVFQSLYSFYVAGVLAGTIKSEQTKTQLARVSDPYNPLHLLAAGRTEIFASLAAIGDNPILGHGSWAKDTGGKYHMIIASLAQGEDNFYYIFEKEGDKDLLIPTHSILTGAWVSGGIFAFFAVLNILYIYLRKAVLLFKINSFRNSLYFPLITFFTLNIIWVFFFSPLQELKSTVPLPLVLIFVLFEKFSINESQKLHRYSLKQL
ncbi:hypothetical protein [Flavobacterium sp. LB2P6]|uniref:hypothetical protein n=1 Tax=Flavobacterium sp. LB2P6 TaxID=3401714 RepID=UPI003AAB803D